MCSEINGKAVYPVGVFYGRKKLEDANEFLQLFTEEWVDLMKNGLKGKDVTILCKALICDPSAKAFVLFLKRHTGYNSCNKCQIKEKKQKVVKEGKKRGE